jgi:hypothetical protein
MVECSIGCAAAESTPVNRLKLSFLCFPPSILAILFAFFSAGVHNDVTLLLVERHFGNGTGLFRIRPVELAVRTLKKWNCHS